jgi:hypothetical protein
MRPHKSHQRQEESHPQLEGAVIEGDPVKPGTLLE